MDVVIPGYRIIKKAAKGGMASIFVAIQQNFDRLVALKIMAPHLTDDPVFGERFQREARIVSRLNHRNIVPVFDVGQHDPYHYLAMEYLPGGDLKSRLRVGVEPQEALRVVYEIANALAYAHSKSYIHRDIKPENILFREDATVVLTDFGIAKAMDGSDLNMTCTGVIVGSPHYMSPEQALAKSIDSRTDIYSLGVVLYEALTGHPMYEADSSVAAAIKHVSERIPRLPKRFKHLQRILEKMVAKTPDNRFQTAAEVADALEPFLQTPPSRNASPLHTGSWVPKRRSARHVLHIPDRTSNALPARPPIPATSNAEPTLIDSRFQSSRPRPEPAAPQTEQPAPAIPAPPAPPTAKRKPAALAGLVLSPLVALGLWLAVGEDDNTLSVGPGESFAASPDSASPPALAADDAPIAPMAFFPAELAPQYISIAPLPTSTPYTATPAQQPIPLLKQAAPTEENPEPATGQSALAGKLTEPMAEQAASQQQPPEPTATPVDPAQAEIDQLLQLAKAAIQRHHLTFPAGGSAYDHLAQVLQLQPGHPAALQGLEQVVNAYLTLAGRKLNEGDLDTAMTYAQRAQKITEHFPLPASSQVAITQLQRTVTELQQKEERLSYLETMWEIEKWSTTLQQPDELTVENLDHAYNIYMAAIDARIQTSRLDTAHNIYADAFYALGRRYLKDNQLDMSRQLITKGLQINPQHQNLQKLLARWERRRDGKESLFDRFW